MSEPGDNADEPESIDQVLTRAAGTPRPPLTQTQASLLDRLLAICRRDNPHDAWVRQLRAIAFEPADMAAIGDRVLAVALGDGSRRELLPTLHQMGCRLSTDPRRHTDSIEALGKLLGMGHWSYPELLAPDLLLNPQAVNHLDLHLAGNLVSKHKTPEEWLTHIEAMAALPHAHLLGNGRLNGAAKAIGWDPAPSQETLDRIRPVVVRIVQWGWIEPAAAMVNLAGDLDAFDAGRLGRWWSEIAREQLEASTGPAARAGRGARL